jgi:hypothetical protein
MWTVGTKGTPMKTTAWIAAAALITACGAAPGEPAAPEAGQAAAMALGGGGHEPTTPVAAFLGTYRGTMTIRHGPYTYTLLLGLEVDDAGGGLVRIPLRDLCPSLDAVDVAAPEALAIVLSAPGAWSFVLPTGERVRAQSFQITFAPGGATLSILARGEVENEGPLEWTFQGAR